MRRKSSSRRQEMTRPTKTRTRTRAYHQEDDALHFEGDFTDYEDWMIGTYHDGHIATETAA